VLSLPMFPGLSPQRQRLIVTKVLQSIAVMETGALR